jgi:hypothetical protein
MKSLIFCLFFAPIYSQLPAPFSLDNWDHEMIQVSSPTKSGVLMSLQPIFDDKWNQLNQPIFWKQIMRLSPDSCVFNVAANRQILVKYSAKKWARKTPALQKVFKDSLRKAYNLVADEKLMCTTGKNHFYKFDDVYSSLTKGILAFESFQVDPWYAQAILLIESPGQLVKSNVGAYGAFQLMPGVARAQGLKVNKTIDERKDFNRSAYAAASLIRKSCIPLAKSILDSKNITYHESDLWFRLFVMHVYHAGAGNVRAVFDKINPITGGQELITQMWQTEAGSFGNSSQNYSQLVIASQMILHEMVGQDCSKLFQCTGD